MVSFLYGVTAVNQRTPLLVALAQSKNIMGLNRMQKRSLVRQIFFTVVMGTVAVPLFAQYEGIWFDRYSEAVRAAKETGKPIFLEFRCEP
jgi:hypothetical protein